MHNRIALIVEGHADPIAAKTAVSLLRYRGEHVVAVIDSQNPGKTAGQLLGVGGDVPVVAALKDAAQPDAVYVGVAPAGGRLPQAMRSIILEAASQGIDVVAGLHQFLGDDAEIASAAKRGGATLTDVRKNDEHDVADRKGLRAECLRIHTVGQDCSCGKMVTSVELALGLQKRGLDAKFIATGQTGIMVAPGINAAIPMTDEERHDPTGGGLPIDCVVADFINGASEKLVKRNQHHDIIVLEGQSTLVHPSYSSVTYGLLHGTLPHGLVLCYEPARPHLHGRPHLPLTPLAIIKKLYDHVSNLEQPCEFIGVAMSSRRLKDDAAVDAERKRVEEELGLPVCDVWREGPGKLVDAAIALRQRVMG